MAHDAKIRPMDAPHTDPDPSVTAAPTAQARDRISGYIQLGEKEGARLIVDGWGEDGEGFFLGPTLFDQVTPEMTIAKEEIFGPVLALESMEDLDRAIANLNASEFGNAAAIFTRDGGAARRFVRGAQAGMIGVNVSVPAPVAYFPFSGWRGSFYGDLHATGRDGVEFYTEKKGVTSRWPGAS